MCVKMTLKMVALCSLQVTGKPDVRFTSHGSVLEVPVRITVNQHADTIDGLIARRQFLHMGMLNNLKSEVEQELKSLDVLLQQVSHLGGNDTVVGASEGVESEHKIQAFVDSARATCKSLMDKHRLETTDAFNDDEQFSELVKEGVGMKKEALKGDAKYVLLGAWLRTACTAGSFDMYQALVQAGADTSGAGADKDGKTLLLAACEGGNFAIFDALIKAGADASGADADKDGKTLLLAACEGGSLEICEALIKAGADASVQDNWGRTPLLAACEGGNFVMCEALIKADADVSVQDKGGRTPLLAACEGGNMAIFDAVIKAGADASGADADKDCKTLLLAACEGGSLEICEALVEAGADIHIARHDGATTLALSVKSANWKLVEYVLQRRSKVLDSSDPIVVASDLVQLASAYVQPVGIHAQLRDGASPLALRGEMGALLSALETTKDIIGADHAATLKVQLGHVRAFVDHHHKVLQNPPVSLAHTVTQLAAQEPDVVFGGGQATMPATETANQPAMIEWLNKPQTTRPCQWTQQAGESVKGVAYSPDGTRLARAVGNDVVVCDAVSGFEVCRLTGHRYFLRCMQEIQNHTYNHRRHSGPGLSNV